MSAVIASTHCRAQGECCGVGAGQWEHLLLPLLQLTAKLIVTLWVIKTSSGCSPEENHRQVLSLDYVAGVQNSWSWFYFFLSWLPCSLFVYRISEIFWKLILPAVLWVNHMVMYHAALYPGIKSLSCSSQQAGFSLGISLSCFLCGFENVILL